MFAIDHGQTVCTVQFLDGGLEGDSQIWLILELVIQQVSDDFGISIRSKHVTQCFQLFTQGFMVFDDAVVHHRDVAREMRVSIALARGAVGCPTGVRNAEPTNQRVFGQRNFQFADFARTAHALESLLIGVHRHTGAVIATVFQAFETFEQDGGDITFSNCADNSTHAYFS